MKLGIANQFWTGLKFFLEVAFLSIVFPEYILVTCILLLVVDHHLLLDKLRNLNIYRVLIILVLNILLLRSNNLLRAPWTICFLVGYYHVVHLLNSVYILLKIETLIRLLVCVLILIINNIILLLTWHYWIWWLHEELLWLVVTIQI